MQQSPSLVDHGGAGTKSWWIDGLKYAAYSSSVPIRDDHAPDYVFPVQITCELQTHT